MLLWVVAASALSGVVSVCAAALYLALPAPLRRALVPASLSFASGTLLGAAFLDLLPEALSLQRAPPVMSTALAGIVGFFLLERMLLWRHSHEDSEQTVPRPLVILGDTLHNFLDGVVIAGAFAVSLSVGVATSIAVFAHEIPQELGDFAIFLATGASRRRALLLNLASSVASVAGAVGAYYVLGRVLVAVPYVMAVSAAGFIYVAVADLFPHLHRVRGTARAWVQPLLILAGIGTIALVGR